MRQAHCTICNSLFNANHSRAKYCSDACRGNGKRRREKLWARKFRLEQPERHLEVKRKQYQKMKQDTDKYSRYLEKGREWRRNNIERAREFSRNWMSRNKAWMIARNASNRSNREPMSPDIVNHVFKRDDYTCQYCGSKKDITIDHVHPIVRSGTHESQNLCVACRTCNCSKGAKTVEEFLIYLEEIKC